MGLLNDPAFIAHVQREWERRERELAEQRAEQQAELLHRMEQWRLADRWRDVQWRVDRALADLRPSGGGAEGEYIAELARCVGLTFEAAARKGRKRPAPAGQQRTAERLALAYLQGVRAAERAAAADWPPILRHLLRRLARDF